MCLRQAASAVPLCVPFAKGRQYPPADPCRPLLCWFCALLNEKLRAGPPHSFDELTDVPKIIDADCALVAIPLCQELFIARYDGRQNDASTRVDGQSQTRLQSIARVVQAAHDVIKVTLQPQARPPRRVRAEPCEAVRSRLPKGQCARRRDDRNQMGPCLR